MINKLKYSAIWVILFLIIITSILNAQNSPKYLGSSINAPFVMNYSWIEQTDVKNKPLLNKILDSDEIYWANQVEQYEAAGLDFVAPWLKGYSPVNGESTITPLLLKKLVEAIADKGLTGKITIMPYDDNPASWTAAWNFAEGRGYGYAQKFPVNNQDLWVYVWDYNLKAFFDAVPFEDLFKINGHPVFCIWSGSSAFLANLNGNGSKLIKYIKDKCEERYGWRPYFRAPTDWIQNDPSSSAPGIVDQESLWFEPNPRPTSYSWSIRKYGNFVNGVVVPSFDVNGEWLDPDHGNLLATGLKATRVNNNADINLIEGFDNYFEDCALWRARNINSNGSSIPYQTNGYDYPNQRINITRRYSNNPFPKILKMEAEWCDEFGGYPSSPNIYRNGNISIKLSSDITDPKVGYVVNDLREGQWLKWYEVPFQKNTRFRIRYSTIGDREGKIHFVIDDKNYDTTNLPATKGENNFQDLITDVYTFADSSYHSVKIVFDTTGVILNRLNIESDGGDIIAPTPNPPEWFQIPTAIGPSVITMTAATGNDLSGKVEYFFDETSGNLGGTDSKWQSSPTYSNTGLVGETEYTYRILMRDSYGNTGSYSTLLSVITLKDTIPPFPPTGLTSTSNKNIIWLKWNSNQEIDLASYNVYRTTTSGKDYKLIAKDVLTNTFADKTTEGYNEYFYVVTAKDVKNNESYYSIEIKDRTGGNSFTNIESHNYPGLYINSDGLNKQAKIVQSADTLFSGQWNIVAGLADNKAISFESAETADHFLCITGANLLQLVENNGSDIFKNNATFYVRKGWADTSKYSFESYINRGCFIRHANYLLWVDPINSSIILAKNDATFKVNSDLSNKILTSIESEHSAIIPKGFQMEQNCPNPFNHNTIIKYEISQNIKITLKVYNILGYEVAELVNDIKLPGKYIVEFNASGLQSGIYYYRLTAGKFNETMKMMLIK